MADEIRMPQLDPEETGKQLLVITKLLDEMPSETRDIHNWLQDKLMPVMGRLQAEVSAVMYYVGIQEDRIGALEEGQGGGIDPEDAEFLLSYLRETVEVFTRLQAETKIPNLGKLVEQGKACIEMVEEYASDDDDDEHEDERGKEH